MGKRTLWTGIVLGAVVGGLTALLDEGARRYVKEAASQVKTTTHFYMNNPSEAVISVRKTVKILNDNLGKGAETAMNALEKLEQRLDEKDLKDPNESNDHIKLM